MRSSDRECHVRDKICAQMIARESIGREYKRVKEGDRENLLEAAH